MRQVKARDGTVRDVADSYILANGESYVVALTMMDSQIMVHDGRGRPAGQRPGFLYSTSNNEQARVEAYSEYRDAIQQRWRGPQPPSSKPPMVFDSPQAAVAAAYTEYNDAIQQRWRK